MPFTVKQRGKLTYYPQGERPVLSSLATEEFPDGDLKISFAGLTGGRSAKNVLVRDELVTMGPASTGVRILGALAAGGGDLQLAP